MAGVPLLVFATERQEPPLLRLRDALKEAGHPTSIMVDIAGEASEEVLLRPHWEAAFVRWKTPEIHEVVLIERLLPGEEEIADAILSETMERLQQHPVTSGKLIVEDYLRNLKVIYALQLQPALLADDDHPAWATLDIILRFLAEGTEGIIYTEAAGFWDADGELLLEEGDETEEE